MEVGNTNQNCLMIQWLLALATIYRSSLPNLIRICHPRLQPRTSEFEIEMTRVGEPTQPLLILTHIMRAAVDLLLRYAS